MRLIFSRYSLLVTALAASPVLAAPAVVETHGADVVVVYNSRQAESRKIAEYYALKRQVPSGQVFGLELPTSEVMTRDEFERQLQEPLLRLLEQAKLFEFDTRKVPATNGQPARTEPYVRAARVRYAVLCYGVPLKIAPDPSHNASASTNLAAELRRNEAAVDSELAVLPHAKQNYPLAGPLQNLLYSVTNATWMHPTNGLLMVARLDGPTPEIARGLVDKALAAERDGLWGRAYFDARGLEKTNSYFSGDEWMRGAATAARVYGFDVELDERPETLPVGFPLSQIAIYAGWYDGQVSGPFTRSTVEFMPGAIAYHLNSFSAATVRSDSQNWAGPLLAKGVTATMGCVFEPYLAGTPNVHAFFGRLLLLGFTFGEAAYASQSTVSWQTTVIGDPLYRPFGRTAPDLHADLLARRNPMLAWSEERVVNLSLVNGIPLPDAENYLHELPMAQTNAVLMETLGEIYERRGKPYSSASARLKALQLGATPQQAVRLTRLVVPQLIALGRQADALEALLKLTRDQPDHPDKLMFLRQALPLAQGLDRKSDAEAIGKEIARLEPATRK